MIEQLAYFFPELGKKQAHVMAVLKGEEEDFLKTLDKGVRHFNKVAKKLSESGVKVVPGAEAWFLSSSLGFPLDLTQIMAEEQGLTVDEEGYNAARQAEKDHNDEALASRKATTAKDMTLEADQTSQLQKDGVAPTDYQNKYVWHHEPSAVVKAVFAGRAATEDGKGFVPSAGATDGVVALVLDTASFYAEARRPDLRHGPAHERVRRQEPARDQCTTHGGFVLHTGVVENGTIAVGDKLNCMVDYARGAGSVAPPTDDARAQLRAARGAARHGRARLGEGRPRRGQGQPEGLELRPRAAAVRLLVGQARHARAARPRRGDRAGAHRREARRVRERRAARGRAHDPRAAHRAGRALRARADTEHRRRHREDARRPEERGGPSAVEFCGGTHITKTSDAATFALLEESGVAKGIRRITAVTREKAREAIAEGEALAERVGRRGAAGQPAELEKALKVLATDLDKAVAPAAVHALRSRVEALQKTLLELKKKASKEAEAAALKDAKALAAGAKPGELVASASTSAATASSRASSARRWRRRTRTRASRSSRPTRPRCKFSVFVLRARATRTRGLDATRRVAAVRARRRRQERRPRGARQRHRRVARAARRRDRRRQGFARGSERRRARGARARARPLVGGSRGPRGPRARTPLPPLHIPTVHSRLS